MGMILDGVTVTEDEHPVVEAPEVVPTGAEAEGEQPAEDGEVVVTFGDEPPEEDEDQHKAPLWVKDLRKANRALVREKRELESRLAQTAPAPSAVVIGPKPTLAGCEYDEAKFEADLAAWVGRQSAADAQERDKADKAQKAQDAWQAKLAAYAKAGQALKGASFDEAEEAVKDALSSTQQGIIINGIRDKADAARMVLALGNNPKKLAELAAMTDPIEYAVAIGELRAQMKVTTRKPAPVPEKVVRGSSPVTNVADKTIEKMREKAMQTGDLTELNRYRKQLREQRRA